MDEKKTGKPLPWDGAANLDDIELEKRARAYFSDPEQPLDNVPEIIAFLLNPRNVRLLWEIFDEVVVENNEPNPETQASLRQIYERCPWIKMGMNEEEYMETYGRNAIAAVC